MLVFRNVLIVENSMSLWNILKMITYSDFQHTSRLFSKLVLFHHHLPCLFPLPIAYLPRLTVTNV